MNSECIMYTFCY